MPDNQPRQVRTGSDPRQLPDFIALSQELSKLTHPARPDVDWKKVENLALALFEHNGVELQTAAWYTLAKTNTASVRGMREGLVILNTLITHQWAVMWPQQNAARLALVSGLSLRLQKVFRTLPLTCHELQPLYDCDRTLSELGEALSRQGQKQAAQLDGLQRQIKQAITRLENDVPQNAPQADATGSSVLPGFGEIPALYSAMATASPVSLTGAEPGNPALVYVVQSAPSVGVSVEPAPVADVTPPPKRWPLFIAGMAAALLMNVTIFAGWWYLHKQEAVSPPLAATVGTLPALLTSEQIEALRLTDNLESRAALWVPLATRLLNSLAAQPPDWNLRYGNQLLTQAKMLWPRSDEVARLQRRWQQEVAVNTLPESSLTGWYDGMAQLRKLADKLNALDGQKGKYMTVSELKSSVFGMLTSFRQTIPAEEQLRQLQLLPAGSPRRQQQIQQLDQHLRAQLSALAQEKERTPGKIE
ncbi:TPA: hypothetical protein JG914_004722 [Enterobacter hormaechei subsp. steigerwaltii]|nr:hypothetical protein [Enterobacter hormaechei subsp. steigerwaltii]